MDERSSLLKQLHIERGDRPEERGRGWRWALVLFALCAAGAAASWWLWLRAPPAIVVAVVRAEPVTQEGAALRGSILDASGYVIPRRQATVSAKITGKVVEVSIEEGQRVEAGQVVARLDDTNFRAAAAQAAAQLEHAEATLDAAQVALENAEPIFRRNQEQFAQAVISAQTFDTAKAAFDVARTDVEVAQRAVEVNRAVLAVAERNLEDTIVRAPFAGVVTVKAAQEGEMVSPVTAGGGFTRTGIGTIVDMDSLEVEVDVSENFINRVRPSQDVVVRLNAYPDWAIPARVIAIIPTADRAKATVRVRVGLAEKDARILPQMGVRVSFLTDDREALQAPAAQPAVIVPHDAVRASGETGVVFIVHEASVERRAVRLGARTAEGQIITSGIAAGEELAVGDLSLLSDGARIRVAN